MTHDFSIAKGKMPLSQRRITLSDGEIASEVTPNGVTRAIAYDRKTGIGILASTRGISPNTTGAILSLGFPSQKETVGHALPVAMETWQVPLPYGWRVYGLEKVNDEQFVMFRYNRAGNKSYELVLYDTETLTEVFKTTIPFSETVRFYDIFVKNGEVGIVMDSGVHPWSTAIPGNDVAWVIYTISEETFIFSREISLSPVSGDEYGGGTKWEYSPSQNLVAVFHQSFSDSTLHKIKLLSATTGEESGAITLATFGPYAPVFDEEAYFPTITEMCAGDNGVLYASSRSDLYKFDISQSVYSCLTAQAHDLALYDMTNMIYLPSIGLCVTYLGDGSSADDEEETCPGIHIFSQDLEHQCVFSDFEEDTRRSPRHICHVSESQILVTAWDYEAAVGGTASQEFLYPLQINEDGSFSVIKKPVTSTE